tara:strand:+ start:7575 stop:8168 length:594 start_codon:yes stop_codon:yes gene_type:complete
MPITFTEETTVASQYIRVHTPQNKWRIVNYEKEEIEFDVSKGMAIDIKNVKFGWLAIDKGFRDWQPWPSPSQRTTKPEGSVEYKNGFEVEVYVPKHGHATFSSNTMAVGNFIAAVYNRVENEKEFASGKVPVVKVTGSAPIITATGNTTYDIGFVVDKWIDMPDREESESQPPVSQEVKEEAVAQAPSKPDSDEDYF